VLIVDDDPVFLDSLCDAVEAAGYPTLRAADLIEALALLRRKTPLVVVLDLHLDQLDPAHVVDAVRGAFPGGPVVVYSGYPDLVEAARRSVATSGVTGTLTKPFEIEDLLDLLGRIGEG